MTPPREAGGNTGDEAQPAAHPGETQETRETWETWETWELRLYVTGRSPACVRALTNLERACAHWLPGRYHIEVVDLLENPRAAAEDQIVAVPTLVKTHPPPIRKIVGDLANTDIERLLFGLQLPPGDSRTM